MASAVVLLICLPIHEFAHAFAANRLGDPTAKNAGRLTLNPFAHLSLWGSLALILFGFGWANPVPVDSSRLKNPKKDMGIIALAGPFSNVILGFIAITISNVLIKMLWGVSPTSTTIPQILLILSWVFRIMAIININLAFFNLIPLLPFDGGNILAALLPDKSSSIMRRFYYKYQNVISVVLIALLYLGVLSKPLQLISDAVIGAFDKITRTVLFM